MGGAAVEEKVEKSGGEKEGNNLLGDPTFEALPNGRFKCVETGHELPSHAKDEYSRSKHCRLGLIHYALANNKPPLNMFNQHPLHTSKLICKLTGDTINKSEEHIWKHINGKRFFTKLEQMESGKLQENGKVEQGKGGKQEKDGSKSKAKNKKKKDKKKKEKKKEEIISEVRDSPTDSDAEEPEFWMPPVGQRWDFDDGGDRWGSDSESTDQNEDDDGPDVENEEDRNASAELSRRAKRMSIEIGPSSFASQKKKSKTEEKEKLNRHEHRCMLQENAL